MNLVEVIVTGGGGVLTSFALQWLRMQYKLEQLLPLVQQLFVLVTPCSY